MLWYVDEQGNSGKSWLAKWLEVRLNAFIITGGRYQDVAYLYNYEELVVFDFARDQEERFPYKLIEDFKNGRVLSMKYEPVKKMFPSAKVIVFTNWQPDRTKLSPDRWDVQDMSDHYVPSSQP